MTNNSGSSNRWQTLAACAGVIGAAAALMVVPEFRRFVLRAGTDGPVAVKSEREVSRPTPPQTLPSVSLHVEQTMAAGLSQPTRFTLRSVKNINGFSVALEELRLARGNTEARLTLINNNPNDEDITLNCAEESFAVDSAGVTHKGLWCSVAGGEESGTAGGVLVPGVKYTASIWFDGAIAIDSVIPAMRLEGGYAPVSVDGQQTRFKLEWRDLKPHPCE